jgi:hypothetical protein
MRSSREGLMLKALELTGKGENYSYGIAKITDLEKEPI